MKLKGIRNRRGFLLAETTVKIIIAVIVLGFLIYLLTSLYFSKVRTINQEKAEKYMSLNKKENLKDFIENVSDGDRKEFYQNVDIVSGWYLFSFTGEDKPTKCEMQNCLCICENVVDVWGKQVSYCQDYGACIIVPELKNYEEELEIYISSEDIPTLIIEKDVGGIVTISKK